MSKKKGLPRHAPVTVDYYQLRAALSWAEWGFANAMYTTAREKFDRGAIAALMAAVGLKTSYAGLFTQPKTDE